MWVYSQLLKIPWTERVTNREVPRPWADKYKTQDNIVFVSHNATPKIPFAAAPTTRESCEISWCGRKTSTLSSQYKSNDGRKQCSTLANSCERCRCVFWNCSKSGIGGLETLIHTLTLLNKVTNPISGRQIKNKWPSIPVLGMVKMMSIINFIEKFF